MIQKIKNLFWHLPKSIFYNFYYAFPSRKLILIGVTGTDGKTTTATLIHHLLKESGIQAGLITTIGAKLPQNREISTGLHMTSPDSSLVQRILKEMHQAGATHVVCEITAHALEQYRYFGCRFQTSLITNTSHEHLDYFHDMDTYIKAKALLFKQSLLSILNKDDPSYDIIKKGLPKNKILTYSIDASSDLQATNIKIGAEKLDFDLNSKKDKQHLSTNSPYHYQVYNILAALLLCQSIGFELKDTIPLLKAFPETKGRREEVQNPFQFRTIVDFAHTPNALTATLSSLKKHTPGKLIVIFGATGGRDQAKRPFMGTAAEKFSDVAILTSDDTRSEKVQDINKQIASGFSPKAQLLKVKQLPKNKGFSYYDIPNRQDAFNLAVKIAKPGDTIIACGKGHESSILLGSTEYPWSEPEAFRTAFRNRQQS